MGSSSLGGRSPACPGADIPLSCQHQLSGDEATTLYVTGGYNWPEIWQRVLSTWTRQVGELASLVASIRGHRLAVIGGQSSPGGERAANFALPV